MMYFPRVFYKRKSLFLLKIGQTVFFSPFSIKTEDKKKNIDIRDSDFFLISLGRLNEGRNDKLSETNAVKMT